MEKDERSMAVHGRVTHDRKILAGRDGGRLVEPFRNREDHPMAHISAPVPDGKTEAATVLTILKGGSLPTVQRQNMAVKVGRAMGNRYLSRVAADPGYTLPAKELGTRAIQRDVKPEPMQSVYRARTVTTPLPVDVRSRLSAEKYLSNDPWMPDPISQNPTLSRVLLTLYARMSDLWTFIPLGAIDWLDEKGSMDFVPSDMDTFRTALTGRGYTGSYFAKASDNLWGLREPNLPVAGLHIRGKRDGKVNVHIDLHPPSWTGFWHWFMDSFRRGSTHTPEALQAGVERLGVYIPVLYEQRIHGELTVLLNGLAAKTKGVPAVQAEIDEGLDYLRQAGALLWNKPDISQEELSQAGWFLGLARASASGASRSIAKNH